MRKCSAPALIGPGVGRIEFVRAAAIARHLPDLPVIAAEVSVRGADGPTRPSPLTVATATIGRPPRRQHVGARRRLIFGVGQEGGVFGADVRSFRQLPSADIAVNGSLANGWTHQPPLRA